MISPTGILKRSKSGFTLIEILLVVLILAIIVAAAIPRFQGTLTQLQARTTAKSLYQLALFAKERAIIEQTFYLLKYDPNQKSVFLMRKEAKKFVRIQSRLGKAIQIKEHFSLQWSSSSKDILFTPNGESDKVEIHLNQNRKRLFTLTIGNPLGRITLKDAS